MVHGKHGNETADSRRVASAGRPLPASPSAGARRLGAGAALVAAAVVSVFAKRGSEKPWVPDCPSYRQKGSPDAKVTIVEFSDFECPACASAVPAVKHIEGLYGRDVRVLYKHHPWSFHKWAKQAAVAAECAGRQGKFWELHDLLFQNQTDWGANDNPKGADMIDAYAKRAGVEPKAFEACRNDPGAAAAVESDLREAKEHWINSTPTFFVNGLRFVGGRQLGREGLLEIENLLRK